eukprot:2961542-Rhodomonas_salina.2
MSDAYLLGSILPYLLCYIMSVPGVSDISPVLMSGMLLCSTALAGLLLCYAMSGTDTGYNGTGVLWMAQLGRIP